MTERERAVLAFRPARLVNDDTPPAPPLDGERNRAEIALGEAHGGRALRLLAIVPTYQKQVYQ